MSQVYAMNSRKSALMKNQPNRILPRSKKSRMAKSAPSLTIVDRHKVLHNYHDHAQVTFASKIDVDQQVDGDKRKGPRGGVTVPFPAKLHVMLSMVNDSGLSHIVSWQPHGRCFVVHKPREFVAEIMPTYFRQSKLTSFQRQLNLYGFSRITTGKDRGGYYHEYFLRHRIFLCQNMSRIRIKGTGIKGKASPETEPDFYSMPFVEPEDASEDLNRDLEGEVAAAMEEENSRSEPARRPSSKPRDRRSKKIQVNTRKTQTVYSEVDIVHYSPRSTSVDISGSSVVTPDLRSKKHLLVPSSFDIGSSNTGHTEFRRQLSQSTSRSGDQLNLFDLCPPLLSSDSEDTSSEELHSGDEIMFEGKNFHYLDSNSFVASAPAHVFSLEPRKSVPMPQYYQEGVGSLSFSRPAPDIAESAVFITQSLREPILTPSSSSSSLAEMFEQDESLEINPDTIFSDKGFNVDWDIGGEDIDIDAEFSMLDN